jgi:hypothetical protein
MHFHSMTRTLIDAIVDQDKLSDIEAADSTFTFNCRREHLFGDADRAPFELTWAGNDQKFENVGQDAVSADLWALWVRFRDAIASADAGGRVQWQGEHDNSNNVGLGRLPNSRSL